MRVLFYSHDSTLYGATRSLLNVIDGLKTYDVECHVVLPYPGSIEGILVEKKIPYKVMPHYRWVSEIKPRNSSFSVASYRHWLADVRTRLQGNIRALKPHLEYVKSLNPDIVYTNTSVNPLGSVVSVLLKKKHVWHVREFKDIDHGMYLDFGNGLFKFLASFSSSTIVISHALQAHYSKVFNPSKTFVVHNGIAFQNEFDVSYRAAKKSDAYAPPYTFGIVGHVVETKGQRIAVEALALLKGRHPDIKLIIAGSGNKEGLKKLARERHIEENVVLVDFINNPYEIYYSIDAYLMCSLNEAFGRVTVEAMSACLPVIGYDNAGTSEIIEHERTGLLYKGGPDQLARAMERFINDPSWARQMGRNGWETAREKYNIEVYTSNIYQILRNVYEAQSIN